MVTIKKVKVLLMKILLYILIHHIDLYQLHLDLHLIQKSITSGFTSYTKEDFNDDNQKELANYFYKLDLKNAKLMLSNSNPKNVNKDDNFFENIYKGFVINEVSAKRMINANAKGRGEISELLITNYEEQSKWESQKNSTMKMIALA